MNSPKKIKLVISLAIILVIALFATTIIQIVLISKAKKEIAKQEKQIEQLNKELDNYNNKNDDDYYEVILTGENI